MKVREVMSKTVHVTTPDEDLEVAGERMRWYGIRHLVVVERGDRLCGVLSERDVFAHRMAARETLARGSTRRPLVENVMKVPVEIAGPDNDIREAAAIMATFRIGCLPVVDGGEIVGIVTNTDLLAAFGEQIAEAS